MLSTFKIVDVSFARRVGWSHKIYGPDFCRDFCRDFRRDFRRDIRRDWLVESRLETVCGRINAQCYQKRKSMVVFTGSRTDNFVSTHSAK